MTPKASLGIYIFGWFDREILVKRLSYKQQRVINLDGPENKLEPVIIKKNNPVRSISFTFLFSDVYCIGKWEYWNEMKVLDFVSSFLYLNFKSVSAVLINMICRCVDDDAFFRSRAWAHNLNGNFPIPIVT